MSRLATFLSVLCVALLIPGLAAAGPVGAAIAAIKTFAAGSAIGAFVTRLGFSLVLSALSKALQKRPRPQRAGIKTEATTTGGTNPQTFILGRYATSGNMVAPPYSRPNSGDVPNRMLSYVVDISDMPGAQLSRVMVAGEYVADLTPSTGTHHMEGMVEDGKPHLFLSWYDGTQTAADPYMLTYFGSHPDRPWLADMVGTGLTYAVATFRYNRKLFNQLPGLRFEALGNPLYDPRADSSVGGSGPQRWDDPTTWTHTENPAVMIYNVLRGIRLPDGSVWGGAVPAEDLPLGVWFAAMNECDLPVALAAGGTEPQYTAGLEVSVDQEPAEVIEELLKACSGEITEIGGVYKMRVGPPALPSFFFTDDDTVSDAAQSLAPYPGLEGVHNAIHASHPDPESLWEVVDAPPRYNAEWEAEDGGRQLVAEVDLPAVHSGTQAQRLMSAWIEDERRFRRHALTLPPDAVVLEPLDSAAWTSAREGYAAKVFEVGEATDDWVTMLQTFALREREAGDFAWSTADEIAVERPSTKPTRPAPRVLAGFGLFKHAITDESGAARRPALRLGWSTTDLAENEAVEYQVELLDGTALAAGTVSDPLAGEVILSAGVLGLTAYRARARLLTRVGSVWTGWDSVTTDDVRLGAGDLDDAVLAALAGPDLSGIEADLVAAREAINGLAPSDVRQPASWQDASTARDPRPASWVAPGSFGPTGYTMPAAPASLAPRGVVPVRADRAYEVEIRLRVTGHDVGASGTSLRLGFYSWDADGTLLNSNVQIDLARGHVSDGWVTRRAVLAGADVASLGDLVMHGEAASLRPHLRANWDATTAQNGVVEVQTFVIRDGTGAIRSDVVSASLGQVQADLATDYYTRAATDSAVSAALASFDAAVPGGLAASVTQNTSAIASLDGTASAAFVLRAEAGGGAADFQLVAWDNVGGGGSAILLKADKLVAKGSLSADRLSVGNGTNLLADARFGLGTGAIVLAASPSAALDQTNLSVREAGGNWGGRNFPTIRFWQDGTGSGEVNAHFTRPGLAWNEGGVSCQPGQWFEGSCYISAHRCTGLMLLEFLDEGFTKIGSVWAGIPENVNSSTQPDQWQRIWVKGQAPAGAAFVQLVVRKYATASASNSGLFFHKPMLAESHEAATGPAPWSAGGQTDIDGGQIKTGAIASVDYVPLSSGWAVDLLGNAEFNQLVVRSWIVDGAVSDGGSVSGYATPARLGNSVVALHLPLGAWTLDASWSIAAQVKLRHRQSYQRTQVVNSEGDTQTTSYTVRTRAILQWRTQATAGASWTGWGNLDVSAWSNSFSVWMTDFLLNQRIGVYHDVEARILIDIDPGAPNDAHSINNYDNVFECAIVARALRK